MFALTSAVHSREHMPKPNWTEYPLILRAAIRFDLTRKTKCSVQEFIRTIRAYKIIAVVLEISSSHGNIFCRKLRLCVCSLHRPDVDMWFDERAKWLSWQ
jgi:hypothetical protein